MSGLPPPGPGNSMFFANSCAAWRTSPCVAAWWWMRRGRFKHGCPINQPTPRRELRSQAMPWQARRSRHFKQGIRGASDRDIYAKQMIPMAATLTDDTAINNVVAYIDSLPDERPRATLSGDPDRGKSLYTTCAACHGTAGQGIWSTKAPRLSHMSDWYLARQLHNFQQGIRGTHPQDFYGAQMALMAKILPDDRAIDDLLAYIHTL